MKVTNIADIKDMISTALSAIGKDGDVKTATFTVDVGAASKDLIGMIGDSRFRLVVDDVTGEIAPGSTIQVNLETGDISAVVAPKKEATTTTGDKKPAKSSDARTRTGRASPMSNPDVAIYS